jgi:hypothetical protein
MCHPCVRDVNDVINLNHVWAKRTGVCLREAGKFVPLRLPERSERFLHVGRLDWRFHICKTLSTWESPSGAIVSVFKLAGKHTQLHQRQPTYLLSSSSPDQRASVNKMPSPSRSKSSSTSTSVSSSSGPHSRRSSKQLLQSCRKAQGRRVPAALLQHPQPKTSPEALPSPAVLVPTRAPSSVPPALSLLVLGLVLVLVLVLQLPCYRTSAPTPYKEGF